MSIRTILQRILTKPVVQLANRYSSRPDRGKVHDALTKLYAHIKDKPGKKGLVLNLDAAHGKIIIFSDLHKGNKKGSDDFAPAEQNYVAALDRSSGHTPNSISICRKEDWKMQFSVSRIARNPPEARCR